ncbi:MAG: hypothetical protein FWH43_03185 [Endomicrobia bacterium]|nr:hypothetical protein [Endomicrobiia bacterium]
MKRILPVLSAVIFLSCNVFATNFVKISRMTNSIQIKTPFGEVETYKNLDDIPEIIYGTKILAAGGTAEIKIFNTASITLEKNQEIVIMKHPVTKEIEVMKTESKTKSPQNAQIKVWLADHVSASFGSDTKVTFFERYPSIIFGVKKGEAVVKGTGGKSYTLVHGESYEAKQNIVR